MTVSLTEFVGGLGMIVMVVVLGINLVMYVHSQTQSQKDAALVIAVFNVVVLLVFTGMWLVGQ